MLTRKCSKGLFVSCLIFPNRKGRRVANCCDKPYSVKHSAFIDRYFEPDYILLLFVLRICSQSWPRTHDPPMLFWDIWIHEFNLPPRSEHPQVQVQMRVLQPLLLSTSLGCDTFVLLSKAESINTLAEGNAWNHKSQLWQLLKNKRSAQK